MKILIIQTAFLGDLILTLPLVQTLKKNMPDSEIDLLCIPYTQSILENNPYIRNKIVFDKHQRRKFSDLKSLAEDLKKREYEYSIIPHRSLRSGIIALMSGIGNRIAFKKTFFDWLYSETVDYPIGIHEIDRNLSLLKNFKIKNYSRIPELYPSKLDVYSVDNLLSSNNLSGKFVCIAPGSKWQTKRWLPEYFQLLCKKIVSAGISVVLIGGKDDIEICNYITTGANKILNTCGTLSLLETAVLIDKSSLLISNDSAPVHIAGAVNRPIIDLYGPTTPEIGFYPVGEKSISLQVEDLNCRPCGIHGGRKCPVGTFECMKNILPENVFASAMEIINE